jgi:hypothetical protein
MADTKISALTSATTPLSGTEVLPIVQSGVTVKVTNNDLRPKQIQSNATSGVLQIAGPVAAATRVMTVPDANFTAARIDAAQSFTGDQTLATGNLIIGTSGKGIDFSATPGTGTSELLDDYEEGEWTPAYAFGTPGTSAFTYTGGRLGTYTKIGNLVSCFFYLDNVTVVKGTASSDLLVTGLPFTVAGNTNYAGGVVVLTDSYPVAPQSFIAFTGTTTSGLRTTGGAAGVTAASLGVTETVFLRGVIQYQV